MAAVRQHWMDVRADLPPSRSRLVGLMSFLLPPVIWSVVSYVPWIWHPMVEVSDPGQVSYFEVGMRVDRVLFNEENDVLASEGKQLAVGVPANPIYLPAPDEAVRAFVKAFRTPPVRRGEPWLHESILHSITVIFYGFFFSALLGVPLGILCGTFAFFSRLVDPFVDFVRYMPTPAFGALAVAFFGISDAPKVMIIFIGTFFQMVLVIGNTTRQLDPSLLEAAQTLGANRKRLVTRVIVPGILPNLYRDMRILLGWAWTYLIVAELIGASSGISYLINQQTKYRTYDNVFAAIVMIGISGLFTDQILKRFESRLFPWESGSRRRSSALFRSIREMARRVICNRPSRPEQTEEAPA